MEKLSMKGGRENDKKGKSSGGKSGGREREKDGERDKGH